MVEKIYITRSGLIDFAISKQSGVIKEVTEKNAVFAQIGDSTINPTALSEVIDKFTKAGVFDKILTKPITLKDGKISSRTKSCKLEEIFKLTSLDEYLLGLNNFERNFIAKL